MGAEKMTLMRLIIVLVLAAGAALPGCRGRSSREVLFSYGTILRNEYIYNVGSAVPVTIEQTTEFDGAFSDDGLFLFYSSDRDRGNYDIYIRSLSDITSVRVTSHPSKDTSPAISPDGRRLAFVSQREDPEGDIYVVKVDPAELIDKAAESPAGVPSLDDRARNISQYQDPVTKDIKIVRDASPAWSPDGQWIAFSSNRDGKDNVWMTDRNGTTIKQVTGKGGLQPRFSGDGKKIIFVSYRDEGSNGDIYTVDVASGSEKRITKTAHVELYPTFLEKDHEIAYTLVDRDTNGDKKINPRDASVLMYRNLKTGQEYPLTLRSQSSFAPRWSGALRKVNERFNNVIIYSDQIGENININIIPDQGIIPLKNTAEFQHGLAQVYLSEHDDRERYLLGLERVHHFYGDRKDSLSMIYVAKSLAEAGRAYHADGKTGEAARVLAELASLSKEKNDYRFVLSEYLRGVYAGRPGDTVLRGALAEMERDAKKQDYLPFLMEDLGDEERRLGRLQSAVDVYGSLLRKYPKYKRSSHVDFKMAAIEYRSVEPVLPESYVRVINSSNVYLKIDAAKNIIKLFSEERDYTRKIRAAGRILGEYEKKSDREVASLMQYVLGEAHYREGNYRSAGDYLEKTLGQVSKTNYLFYKANMLQGAIAERRGDFAGMEKYFFENVRNYLLRWKQDDFRDILGKLIFYYEDRGGRLTGEKKFAEATNFYDKYITVVTTAHLLRQFEDIYNNYGSRAHLLHIDAFSAGGNEKKKLAELEKKYKDKLAIARLNYDKAYLYGLAYVYSRLGVASDPARSAGGSLKELLEHFRNSVNQIAWALFMDDTYIEPYILQGWISQYVDQRRRELGGAEEGLFGRFFPRLLWEANVPLYEKALAANNEEKNPETEGNIHLNLGNTYFLLNNYPAALRQYEKVRQFKRTFSSPVEEALYHYHAGFCYWQDDQLGRAREEMRRTLMIYNGLAQAGGIARYRDQVYAIYRYFALFSRMERNWGDAITWYNRILEFADKNRIQVDKARYLQEIAGCYRELGEPRQALSFIDKADTILAGQSEDEKKYRLRFKALGLGPVSFLDLGPDTAVIGDSRLFTELDTSSKKILSLSLREGIHFDKGDYARAIDYLKKKHELWSRRDNRINQTARVRTLNNIGYCYYRMGRFNEALKNFKDAWDYAADEGVNDLDGIFNAMLNYSNLYALLLERGSRSLGNSDRELDSLIAHIARYKDSYEKAKFESDLEALKVNAKAQHRELKPEDIEALKEAVAESARGVYHHVDVAVGTLKFTLAEHILRNGASAEGKSTEEGALDVYRHNRRVYDLYAGALNQFKSALEFSEKNQARRVTARLLLNIASCQKRIGMLDEAYETLSGAEDLADDFAYDDLRWLVYFKTAEFLHEYGARVEGAGYQRLAEGYYRKAADMVAECPQCYDGMAHLAGGLFDQYARFLVERGDGKAALSLAETKYAVNRIMLVAASSPEFQNPGDRESYENYNAGVRTVLNTRKKLSALLESGEAADSKQAVSIKSGLEGDMGALRGMARKLKQDNTLFSSFLVVPDITPRAVPGAAVFGFAGIGGKLYAWSLDGKLEFGELRTDGKKDGNDLIREYLAGKCGSAPGKSCFVVMNDTASGTIVRQDLKNYTPFTFIPSFERARYYLRPADGKSGGIYYTGKGLARRLSRDGAFAGVPVVEGVPAGPDLSRYSIIVDAGEYDSVVGVPQLFGRKASPDLLVRRITPLELDQFSLLAEASLYAGIRSLLVYDRLSDDELARVMRAAREKSLDSINRNADFTGVIPVGNKSNAQPAKK